VKNEIRYVEVMIALAEDTTLYNVLPACQEKHLLGVEIVEYNTELLDFRSRRGALRRESAETLIESTSATTPSNTVPERS
jgi:hypothetical protein